MQNQFSPLRTTRDRQLPKFSNLISRLITANRRQQTAIRKRRGYRGFRPEGFSAPKTLREHREDCAAIPVQTGKNRPQAPQAVLRATFPLIKSPNGGNAGSGFIHKKQSAPAIPMRQYFRKRRPQVQFPANQHGDTVQLLQRPAPDSVRREFYQQRFARL